MISKTVDNLSRINTSLVFHKYAALGSLCVSLVLSIVVFLQANQDPIVVIDRGEKRDYMMGDKESYNLTEEDVKAFVVSYVKNRYTWEEFVPREIVGRLSCITTKGFKKKIEKMLGNLKHEGKESERVEQYVAFIRPRLEEGRSFVSFDRILRINGIPLATPGEISLDIIRGARTACNPIGLYVNGITEYKQ